MRGLVDAWLQGIGLGYAVPMCSAHGINTPETLARLEVVDFPELGISDQNDRKKLFYLIQRVRLALNRVREDEDDKPEARTPKPAESDLPTPGVDSRVTPLSIRVNQAEVAQVSASTPRSATLNFGPSLRKQAEAEAPKRGGTPRDAARRGYEASLLTTDNRQVTSGWGASESDQRLHMSQRRRTTSRTNDNTSDSPEDESHVSTVPWDPYMELETDISERSGARIFTTEDARQSAVVATAAANQAVASISQAVSLGVHRPSTRRTRVSNVPILPQDHDSGVLSTPQSQEQLDESSSKAREAAKPTSIKVDGIRTSSTRAARTPRGSSGAAHSSLTRARARSNPSPTSTRSDSSRRKLECRSSSREFVKLDSTSDELPPTPPRIDTVHRHVRDGSGRRSSRSGDELEANSHLLGTPSRVTARNSASPVTPVRSYTGERGGSTAGTPRHSALRGGPSTQRRESGGSSTSSSSSSSGPRAGTPRNPVGHSARPWPITLERRLSNQDSPLSARGSGARVQRSPANKGAGRTKGTKAASEVSNCSSGSTPRSPKTASRSPDMADVEEANDLAVRLISAHREDVTCAVAAARMDEQLVTQSKSGSHRHLAAMNEYARGLDDVLGERLAAATKLRAALDSYIALRRSTTRVSQAGRGMGNRRVISTKRGVEA